MISEIWEKWLDLELKTKAMAIGAVALIVLSCVLTAGNVSDATSEDDEAEAPQTITEEEGLIPVGAEPVGWANEDELLVASLMDVLQNDNCHWIADDDPICALGFTDREFDAYYGDIKASYALEFYSIEATEDGRAGVWRVRYPDGTLHDARFAFAYDAERGTYTISSKALPHETYATAAYTSEDVLAVR